MALSPSPRVSSSPRQNCSLSKPDRAGEHTTLLATVQGVPWENHGSLGVSYEHHSSLLSKQSTPILLQVESNNVVLFTPSWYTFQGITGGCMPLAKPLEEPFGIFRKPLASPGLREYMSTHCSIICIQSFLSSLYSAPVRQPSSVFGHKGLKLRALRPSIYFPGPHDWQRM